MKTWYLIPTKLEPKRVMNEPRIVKVDCLKREAEAKAVELERTLNDGKVQDDYWKALKAGDMAANPLAAWRVDALTFAQARDYTTFGQWPCNQDEN